MVEINRYLVFIYFDYFFYADPETMAFASELCKLCYKLLVGDQVVASAVNDIDPDADGPSNASLSFEQYDVIIPRQRMEAFDIAIMTERGPFTDDVGSFMECSFHDKQIQGKKYFPLL